MHTFDGYRVCAKDRLVELAGRDDCLVLGTETAGLDDEEEVISVAVVATTGERFFHSLVRRTQPVHPRVTAVSGITNVMVADAAVIADICPVLVKVLAGWENSISAHRYTPE